MNLETIFSHDLMGLNGCFKFEIEDISSMFEVSVVFFI